MTTLLIDGDVLLYKGTIISEAEFDWGDDVVTIHSDLGEVRTIIDGIIKSLCEAFETDEVKIALSSKRNFRHTIDETYKANRATKRKPVGFALAKEWLKMEYKCIEVDGLEADDVLGVLATQKSLKGDCVICTIDKDLRQIPGTYHNIDTHETEHISEAEGHRYHMLQTLTGDAVDGYPGCPGVGPVKAAKILEEETPGSWWSKVVAAYQKAGLTEEDALRQARLARILQLEDINPKTKEPILWRPPSSATTAPATSSSRASRSRKVSAAVSAPTTSKPDSQPSDLPTRSRKTQTKSQTPSSSPRTTRGGSSSRSPSSCATSSRSRSATSSSTSCATKTRTVSKTSAKRGATSR